MDKDIFIAEEKKLEEYRNKCKDDARQYVELTRKKNKWKVDYQPHIM